MQNHQAALVGRAWGRARRFSQRMGQRVRGWPVRAREKRLGRPVPPGHLLHLVAGSEDVAWFVHSGHLAARVIRDVLDQNGVAVNRMAAILDFGCGAGRVMRHWHDLAGPALYGTDANPRLVAWCQRHLRFAEFAVNGTGGRLPYENNRFDLVYALSVFTHLSEPLQHHWMAELGRILRPGGHLFVTVHGESYLGHLSQAEAARFRSGALVVTGLGREGSNQVAAFHPEPYVRGTLAQGLELIAFHPQGALGNPHQDVYLMRKG